MKFTLSASEEIKFPLTAFTRSEDFQVDISWDPVEIEPGQKTNFIFTIRDGATGEPMRNSDYTFVILQNGQEIHRASGQAQVGGYFESYEFAEDQTGPTIIRFENIRNTGQETEFESRFSAKSGVFVTLNGPSGLRGCIGYPLPDRDLSFVLRDASVSAATRDPRFPPLKPGELDCVTFEVKLRVPDCCAVPQKFRNRLPCGPHKPPSVLKRYAHLSPPQS